jgi:hypothetical protein
MDRIKQVAIDSFNEQLQELRKEDEIETKVIVTVFNSHPAVAGEVLSLSQIEELNEETYIPDGMTALYDAIGFTIKKILREYKDDRDDTAVLLVTITDGQENDSKEFRQSDIKRMTEELEKTERWTFTYMGANVNPLETAVMDMAYQLSNTLSWQADAVGMRRMSDEFSKGLKGYYDGRKMGMTMTTNFFNDTGDDPGMSVDPGDGSKTGDGLVDTGSKTIDNPSIIQYEEEDDD